MYGLLHVGRLENDSLTKLLAPKGYLQWTHTPGLWRHKWRLILFSLVVDDFGVKNVGKEHADHLISAIREFYLVSEDWNGSLHCGIKLKWDHQKQAVDISMPRYVALALQKYQHKPSQWPQNSLQKYKQTRYEAIQKNDTQIRHITPSTKIREKCI